MSYAEHGSRIFLTGTINNNVMPRKRSEGRLKLFDSCTDLRAWSPNALDNCRYFREVVEKPFPQGKIVPYDVMIESVIVLGNQTQTELTSLRRELARYKSLHLTAEQKKQLEDYEVNSSEDVVGVKNSTGIQESQVIENESLIPKRPETPIHSPSCSFINIHEIDEQSRNDDQSSSDGNSEDSKEVLISSETESMEDADEQNNKRRDDRSASRYRMVDDRNYQAIIIEKDSEIIALKNELGSKHIELEELRELNRRLDLVGNEKEKIMDNLKQHLKISQKQVMDTGNLLHQNIEEWKKKLQDSKCLVDHLKSLVEGKSQECASQSRKIEELHERIKESEALREERDCLSRKLDEMKAVIYDNEELMKVNREQKMNLADQDAEIKRLLELIKNQAKYGERLRRSNVELKNSQFSQLETQHVPIQRESSDTISISRLPTMTIRKMKCHLQEELHEVENELAKRSDDHQQNDRFHNEETVDERKKRFVHLDDWKREKEFMECTIEQLTMQVSASNMANKEQDEIHKQIVSQFRAYLEKIQRLIDELEPYYEERPWLITTINRLNEALKGAQATTESRDINAEEYLSNILEKHQQECEQYKKRIANLTNELRDLQNKMVKIEKSRREKEQRDEKLLDEKIDGVLGNRAKRSTEMIKKLSDELQGAGDYHNREMEKKQYELESRNAEIAKLRKQVASQVSRGQGDQAERENSLETDSLKNELKILHGELTKTREALGETREKLESTEYKLKGSIQNIKELRAQCKKQEREADNAAKTINRLTKENEGLTNTVQLTDELQTKVDEMKPRLDLLQVNNDKLNNEVLKINKLCAAYEIKITDLVDKEMRATQALRLAEDKLLTLELKHDSEIEVLRIENKTATIELEENKMKVNKLTEEIQSLRKSCKELETVDILMQEISKMGQRINKLTGDIAILKSRWDDQRRSNEKLEKNLSFKLADNEKLQNDIRELNKNMESISRIPTISSTVAKQELNTSLHTICDRIEALKSRLNLSESEGQLFRTQIDEWREKSQDDALLIENLRQKIKSYNNKVTQQDLIIARLQEDKQDLEKKLDKIQVTISESSSKHSTQEISNLSSHLENEMRQKDEEIENLTSCIESIKLEREYLIEKNTKLFESLKIEKDSQKLKLEEIQQNYDTQIRQIRDHHNASIKRLEVQYEESIGKPFNPETWLGSLTSKEMDELHIRIWASPPCRIMRERSKIHMLNDKQNKQHQLDENKIHSEMHHLQNEHHKGSFYVYRQRKECVRLERAETPFVSDALEAKKLNFINLCANQLKHGN